MVTVYRRLTRHGKMPFYEGVSLETSSDEYQMVRKRGQDMEHVRRGTLVLVIVTLLAVGLIWYYFAKVYDGDSLMRGTLVECNCHKDSL